MDMAQGPASSRGLTSGGDGKPALTFLFLLRCAPTEGKVRVLALRHLRESLESRVLAEKEMDWAGISDLQRGGQPRQRGEATCTHRYPMRACSPGRQLLGHSLCRSQARSSITLPVPRCTAKVTASFGGRAPGGSVGWAENVLRRKCQLFTARDAAP